MLGLFGVVNVLADNFIYVVENNKGNLNSNGINNNGNNNNPVAKN